MTTGRYNPEEDPDWVDKMIDELSNGEWVMLCVWSVLVAGTVLFFVWLATYR
jgi:hypothetical protein